jgi:diketogulonate reductase-like aldo/keto reductase
MRAWRRSALRLVALAWFCSADDSIPVVLGDGSTQRLQLGWFPGDTDATQAFCSKYSIASDDCATLQRHVKGKRDALGRFFVAATDAAAAPPSRRLFALLDGELMFRSTGTSNPGRNYPRMWLPTAGVCPWWFQQPAAGRPTSFAEITAASTALRAGAEQRVFDKRFAFAYHENEDLEAWAAVRDDLRSMAATDGNGRFAFDRFTSLRQLVVSVRLGREAWVDAGIGAAAAEVLARGAAAGFATEPVAAPRSSPIVVAGLCAVNDFVTGLGVEIVGWSAARRGICAPAPALLVAELERLTRQARGAAVALGVPQTAAMGAAVALTGALTTCSEVRLDGAGPCAFPEIRAELSAYWTHIINLARASGAHDAVDAASQAVKAVRSAANADGRHLVDNARHLVKIGSVPVEYRASMPSLVYGTAWKREDTERLARRALAAGFVGFDTACQPKHYDEPALGRALMATSRERLWIQTKFTPVGGHDDRKPYHVWQPVEDQVRASFSTSLANLGTTYVDALLLHSPLETYEMTLRAWRVLEEFHAAGSVRTLGVSNVNFPTFERLWNESTVKPGIVQNRFYNKTGYDRDLRAFCRSHGVAYQGFWTITGNRNVVSGSVVAEIASRLGKPPVSVYYRALMQLGVVVLDGTKSMDHMREDLEVLEFELDAADVAAIDGALS